MNKFIADVGQGKVHIYDSNRDIAYLKLPQERLINLEIDGLESGDVLRRRRFRRMGALQSKRGYWGNDQPCGEISPKGQTSQSLAWIVQGKINSRKFFTPQSRRRLILNESNLE